MTKASLLLLISALFLLGCPASEDATPDSRIPDGDHPGPEGGVKNDGATGDSQAKPDLTLTKDLPPVDVKPDKAMPDQVIPDKAVPDKAMPDKAAPDKAMPDLVPPAKFGAHCMSKAGCDPNQICLAVVPPGPSGYCTKKCSPSGSVCPGAPAGMRAKCTWPGGPSIYYCVFVCKDGPLAFSCPPKHKCSSSGSCTPL